MNNVNIIIHLMHSPFFPNNNSSQAIYCLFCRITGLKVCLTKWKLSNILRDWFAVWMIISVYLSISLPLPIIPSFSSYLGLSQKQNKEVSWVVRLKVKFAHSKKCTKMFTSEYAAAILVSHFIWTYILRYFKLNVTLIY